MSAFEQAEAPPSRYILLGILAVLATVLLYNSPSGLTFEQDVVEKIPSLLGYMVLVSLFLERAIEVFLSALRSGGADQRDNALKQHRLKITEHEAAMQAAGTPDTQVALAALKKELGEMEEDRVAYSAKSRIVAQWMGLSVGILISMAGVRVMGSVVSFAPAQGSLSNFQVNLFLFVDVFITGAVLAGGSDAINKIMKVYNNAMSKAANKPGT